MSAQQAASPVHPQPNWYLDPSGGHQYRYYDGSEWTGHVADGGQVTQDPFVPPPPPLAGVRAVRTGPADGQQPAGPAVAVAGVDAAPEKCGKAVGSLVCGIIGLLILPVIFSVAALGLGSQARREIDASNGAMGGRGMATAGVVLGVIGLVAWLIVLIAM